MPAFLRWGGITDLDEKVIPPHLLGVRQMEIAKYPSSFTDYYRAQYHSVTLFKL